MRDDDDGAVILHFMMLRLLNTYEKTLELIFFWDDDNEEEIFFILFECCQCNEIQCLVVDDVISVFSLSLSLFLPVSLFHHQFLPNHQSHPSLTNGNERAAVQGTCILHATDLVVILFIQSSRKTRVTLLFTHARFPSVVLVHIGFHIMLHYFSAIIIWRFLQLFSLLPSFFTATAVPKNMLNIFIS